MGRRAIFRFVLGGLLLGIEEAGLDTNCIGLRMTRISEKRLSKICRDLRFVLVLYLLWISFGHLGSSEPSGLFAPSAFPSTEAPSTSMKACHHDAS